jgi:hypothetical protein
MFNKKVKVCEAMFIKFLKKIFAAELKMVSSQQLATQKQIQLLENEIITLKKSLTAKNIEKQMEGLSNEGRIQIDHLNIEYLHIENADLSNNFGQLGIKELQGQLFIGTTYDSLKVKKKLVNSEETCQDDKKNKPNSAAPIIHLSSRKSEQ